MLPTNMDLIIDSTNIKIYDIVSVSLVIRKWLILLSLWKMRMRMDSNGRRDDGVDTASVFGRSPILTHSEMFVSDTYTQGRNAFASTHINR